MKLLGRFVEGEWRCEACAVACLTVTHLATHWTERHGKPYAVALRRLLGDAFEDVEEIEEIEDVPAEAAG